MSGVNTIQDKNKFQKENNIISELIEDTNKKETSINKEDILESKSKKTILIRVDYPKQKDKVYEALKLSLTLNIKYTAIY